MKVNLKGINWSNKRLADGTMQTYWYAWRGGPKLPGNPGDAEFMAAYNAAITQRHAPNAGTLQTIIDGYQQSDDFRSLADRTRSDYIAKIKLIEAEYGTLPLRALGEKGMRGEFMDWRDNLALTSRRQADYAWTVLARILSWALDREKIDANPCKKGGRLYSGNRADFVWSLEDEEAFLEKAPRHLHLPLTMALWTGQRQGDLLRLTWTAYDGQKIRLRQSKTGARVVIPVGRPLKAALDAAKQNMKGPVILLNSGGRPWTEDGFRSSWGKAKVSAGVKGVTFNDLRGTAVTRLALAGCTEAEIAAITGHSLRDVRTILDAHYLHRDPKLAENAITKLEARTKSQTGSQTGPTRSSQKPEISQ